MEHRGFSRIGLSTLDLDRTCEFYAGILGFRQVVADTIKVKEGGCTRHIFFDVGQGQLIGFMAPDGVPDVPSEYDAGINGGLGVPSPFYHFAFDAGSPAALADKRDELRRDPNGLTLEYSCVTRDLTEDDATMRERFTIGRAVLELSDLSGAEITKARSDRGRRIRWIHRAWAALGTRVADRLDFEIDVELETGLITGHAGVPGLIEAFRQTRTAAVIDREIKLKSRKRGLSVSEMVESLLAMWAASGERAEDLDQFRQDKALAMLLGHDLPAAQTARDFLAHRQRTAMRRQGMGRFGRKLSRSHDRLRSAG
jgi:catechol 2,3-dioxygenase-like lactoylglutathione lyase family enzyme